MAITLIEPNTLNFASNPIVFKATTDKSLGSEESMLRIVCSVTFQAVDRVGVQFNVELSQPVEDGGTATFNLSDASQTLIRRIHAEMDMNGGDAFSHIGLHGYVNCYEMWIKDGYEVKGDTASSGRFHVVPGGFTDFEMLTRDSIDLSSIAFPATEMSRMPSGGRILYYGEQLIVPTLSTEDKTATGTLSVAGNQVASGSVYLTGMATDYQRIIFNSSEDGEFVFNSSLTGPITGYYRTNTRGVHFLRFINGFGAVENIAVRAKDKLSYEVSGETHSLVQEISTRPTDRRYATKSQPVGVYELSSGYVPQRWAEWYVQELLTSPRVWIQIGGKWVPALIEAEDDCVIYDRSKPEMPHVDFTLRLAIDGVTGITW